MKLSMEQIKEIVENQRQKWINTDPKKFSSLEEFKSCLEADFVEVNDISDRRAEFADDVDYDSVCDLRRETMIDLMNSY